MQSVFQRPTCSKTGSTQAQSMFTTHTTSSLHTVVGGGSSKGSMFVPMKGVGESPPSDISPTRVLLFPSSLQRGTHLPRASHTHPSPPDSEPVTPRKPPPPRQLRTGLVRAKERAAEATRLRAEWTAAKEAILGPDLSPRGNDDNALTTTTTSVAALAALVDAQAHGTNTIRRVKFGVPDNRWSQMKYELIAGGFFISEQVFLFLAFGCIPVHCGMIPSLLLCPLSTRRRHCPCIAFSVAHRAQSSACDHWRRDGRDERCVGRSGAQRAQWTSVRLRRRPERTSATSQRRLRHLRYDEAARPDERCPFVACSVSRTLLTLSRLPFLCHIRCTGNSGIQMREYAVITLNIFHFVNKKYLSAGLPSRYSARGGRRWQCHAGSVAACRGGQPRRGQSRSRMFLIVVRSIETRRTSSGWLRDLPQQR